MRFHTGAQHLAQAFRRHKAAGSSSNLTDSHLLLLIYAVECGLKKMLLDRRGLHSTERLEQDDLTHNLDELLKKLGSRERFGNCQAEPGNRNVSSESIHEVLRYGGRFDSQKRAVIASRVNSLIEWIEESI